MESQSELKSNLETYQAQLKQASNPLYSGNSQFSSSISYDGESAQISFSGLNLIQDWVYTGRFK